MFAMERFVQEIILIIVLTIWGCFTTKEPYILILLSGLLMCIICDRSLSEERLAGKLIQFILSVMFVVVSDNWLAFLIFYCIGNLSHGYKSWKNKYIQVFMPSVIYFVIQIIYQKQSFPEILSYMFILTMIVIVIWTIQTLIEKYIIATKQVSKAVSVTAVNEMYAKKLNQELVIKNYLADKNARLEERENISRNIHNSVGHAITAAIMTLDAADMLYDTAPDKAREKMNTANERIRTGLASIRQAVRVLDIENRFVSISDFVSELTAVTDSFVMDTMIKVYTDFGNISEEVVIPHEHTEFLTGAMQELLSNGVRHGDADVFTVTLTADSRNLRLKVADNGKSDFSHKNQLERIENGFGLKKMISYIKKCGGTVSFSNDNGFKAEIEIKLFKEEING